MSRPIRTIGITFAGVLLFAAAGNVHSSRSTDLITRSGIDRFAPGVPDTTVTNDRSERSGVTIAANESAKASARSSASVSVTSKTGSKANECSAESKSSAVAVSGNEMKRDSDHDQQKAKGRGCSASAESSATAISGSRPDEKK